MPHRSDPSRRAGSLTRPIETRFRGREAATLRFFILRSRLRSVPIAALSETPILGGLQHPRARLKMAMWRRRVVALPRGRGSPITEAPS